MLGFIILRLIIISIWVLVVWVGRGRTGGQYWGKSHIIIGLMRNQRWVINRITCCWLLLMLYVEPSHLLYHTHMGWGWCKGKGFPKWQKVERCFISRSYNLVFFKGNISAKVQRNKITECHKVVRKSRCVACVLDPLYQHFMASESVGLN